MRINCRVLRGRKPASELRGRQVQRNCIWRKSILLLERKGSVLCVLTGQWASQQSTNTLALNAAVAPKANATQNQETTQPHPQSSQKVSVPRIASTASG